MNNNDNNLYYLQGMKSNTQHTVHRHLYMKQIADKIMYKHKYTCRQKMTHLQTQYIRRL